MLKLTLIMIMILTIIPIIVIIFVLRRFRTTIKQSIGELFPTMSLLSSKMENSDNWNGLDYSYRYEKKGKSGANFSITIPCPTQGSFRLSKMLATDRFFLRTGMSVHVKTGVPLFDDQYFIQTDYPEFAASIFNIEANRLVILHLFKLGFNSIELKNEKLTVSIFPFQFKHQLTKQLAEDVVSHLAKIKNTVPASLAYQPGYSDNWKQKRRLAFWLPSIMGIGGVAALIFSLIKFQPVASGGMFLESLRYSLPAVLFMLWYSAKVLKGRTTSHRDWMLVGGICLIAFVTTAHGVLMFTNGYLDTSETNRYDLRIVDKQRKSSGRNTSYVIYTDSWREGEEMHKFSISSKKFKTVEPGTSMMHVETRAGKWRYEWFVTRYLD
ncbi:hypothetical protein JW960_18755 [candidate division KSB1 bacterium]|nr:hypothetical protein [candidate division KSB1 bacterium]